LSSAYGSNYFVDNGDEAAYSRMLKGDLHWWFVIDLGSLK
jgi:hypothetical protein